MIQVTHDNVFKINGLVSSIELSQDELRLLDEFEKIRFSIQDYTNSEFQALLEDVLSKLQESYKIYLVYVENKSQPKSKMRSYKKMFYSEKDLPHFNGGDINEKEVEISAGQSLMVGSIRLTRVNRNYVINNLLNTNFRFGYLVRKGKKSFRKNIASFLENITSLLSNKSAITRIDLIELLLSQVKKNKNIFRIPYGVNDVDYLEFLIRKEDKDVSQKLLDVENKYKAMMRN